MSTKWYRLHGPITAADAEAEPEAQRLFGSSYDAHMCRYAVQCSESQIIRAEYRPWRKPHIERVRRLGGNTDAAASVSSR
jgi:hypothetical protein